MERIYLRYSRSLTIQAPFDVKSIGSSALNLLAGLRHLVKRLVTKNIRVITARTKRTSLGQTEPDKGQQPRRYSLGELSTQASEGVDCIFFSMNSVPKVLLTQSFLACKAS